MRRILYIMNVDWSWVKQRPHFLAQHLSAFYDLTVLYPFSWRRKHLASNDPGQLKLYPVFRLPLGGRWASIRMINEYISRIFIKIIIWRVRPDIVWLSSAELFAYIPIETRLSQRLIYDCMDDILAFPTFESHKSWLQKLENELIASSTYVFCSSDTLRARLINRSGYAYKYIVLNNAVEPSSFFCHPPKPTTKANRKFIFGYIGTISSWFDFEAIDRIVNCFPEIEVRLVGPIENLSLPVKAKHERIKLIGVASHNDLYRISQEFDVLLMPFVITELVKAVDPVKLYEYIFFNKPIISVKYDEIERFSKFVDFYSNYDELIEVINKLKSNKFKKKYSDMEQILFIKSNTWESRMHIMNNLLNSL